MNAAENPSNSALPTRLAKPLSLADCLNLAETQNGTIRKAKKDLEASHGVVIQTKAIAVPKLQAKSNYQIIDQDSIDKFPFASSALPGGSSLAGFPYADQQWSASVQLVQSIYEGGRISSALRTARLTKEQAVFQFQTTLADTLLEVRVSYDDVLLAAQQIIVQEASVNLLTKELEDTKRRYEAGTVPRFNVLRAEVELANARPRLIRARNSHRTGKQNLVNLLGHRLPVEVWEDLPLQLSGMLSEEPYDVDFPKALAQALERRSELGALRKAEALRRESIITAQAGSKPSVQLFAGYGGRSSQFSTDLAQEVHGWLAGGQLSWNIFDGYLTKGKVEEARALHEKSQIDLDDRTRRIELEVRTAWSNFIEAREVIESQRKVQEQAEEALRLATVRNEAGTGTQLDVLSAQTALTEARTTQIQAVRDYSVARARLERATGSNLASGQIAR